MSTRVTWPLPSLLIAYLCAIDEYNVDLIKFIAGHLYSTRHGAHKMTTSYHHRPGWHILDGLLHTLRTARVVALDNIIIYTQPTVYIDVNTCVYMLCAEADSTDSVRCVCLHWPNKLSRRSEIVAISVCRRQDVAASVVWFMSPFGTFNLAASSSSTP